MGLLSATSSRELVAGRLRCNSPESAQMNISGPEAVHVSRLVPQGKAKAKRTSGTCGPSCDVSSPSAILQRSLASRLRARLGVIGSLEYDLTWKEWDMRSGPPICALRAQSRKWPHGSGFQVISKETDHGPRFQSGRPTFDNGCFGWVSPTAQDGSRGSLPPRPQDTGIPLSQQVAMAGWPTPQVCQGLNMSENRGEDYGGRRARKTPQIVEGILAGWCTPSARDRKDTPGMATTGTNPDGSERNRMDQLPRQAGGVISTLSSVPTEKRGALNPEFTRWLMGYPAAWGSSGATAMRLSRKSPRSSSKRALK